MTPDLIALVLSLPLPVRLALLDADPEGGGRFVDTDGNVSDPMPCAVFKRSPFARLIERGAAFLPCNPLAIVEHAARLYGKGAWPEATFHGSDSGWRFKLAVLFDEFDVRLVAMSQDKCPHTAAVALLREVVG